MLVKVYTDGAARGNPDGPGGYGAVLKYVDPKGNLHMWTEKDSCIQKNCRRAIRRQRITGWN